MSIFFYFVGLLSGMLIGALAVITIGFIVDRNKDEQ